MSTGNDVDENAALPERELNKGPVDRTPARDQSTHDPTFHVGEEVLATWYSRSFLERVVAIVRSYHIRDGVRYYVLQRQDIFERAERDINHTR
ncbi:hypothetical protein LTR91_004725 [Friedmanniomyces endolithicus]|nr:hypothetical protein LTS09_014413 [Friedmanniomyces endolithicus]KAK0267852.1 hypothetical protein LTS00_017718 [Friedmanniomyces endolithicus]KAK0304436.1 hypothetical protein LTR82_017230 [Friedmanniomyces endolithicus]KAK0315376.1 hypothetical protein LTR01_000674 [Friedmanniomyces endolithicus]KAK0920580.1 hypothetical protein LTR57_009630 [Friedmanniomyces endolithicus]